MNKVYYAVLQTMTKTFFVMEDGGISPNRANAQRFVSLRDAESKLLELDHALKCGMRGTVRFATSPKGVLFAPETDELAIYYP
jgi:hypothetical protein